MAGKGYSGDDILEEVRRKKQKETAAKAGTEIQGDFFEMRQKNAVPERTKPSGLSSFLMVNSVFVSCAGTVFTFAPKLSFFSFGFLPFFHSVGPKYCERVSST